MLPEDMIAYEALEQFQSEWAAVARRFATRLTPPGESSVDLVLPGAVDRIEELMIAFTHDLVAAATARIKT